MNKTTLCVKARTSFETIFRTLLLLEQLRLVSVTRENHFPFRQIYQLTPAGKLLSESPIYRWPALLWQWSPAAPTGVSTRAPIQKCTLTGDGCRRRGANGKA